MIEYAGETIPDVDASVVVPLPTEMGYPFYADYNASKAGVVELTRSMALELVPKVRVNAVCPGFVLTPMQEVEYTLEMQRAFASKVPLGKLGRPDEVATLSTTPTQADLTKREGCI